MKNNPHSICYEPYCRNSYEFILHTFCPGVECAENRFDYRKTLVLQCMRHDFLHTFCPIDQEIAIIMS